MHASEGIVTTRGGMTSHAAVVARGMGKPCVSGVGAIRIDYNKQTLTAAGQTLKKGDVLTVEFTVVGIPCIGINGGPAFKHSEAISFQIPVETQAEVNRLSDALSAVPEAEQCGWVKDRYGVSWQIVPRQLMKLMGGGDPARAKRAFDAMVKMKRIDIAAIERAADGNP